MGLALESVILIGGLIFLLAIGIEVFAAVGLVGIIGLVVFVDQPLAQLGYTAFNTLNKPELSSLPLFIFMGAIFSTTGIIRALFSAGDKWLGALPGGLASTIIGVNGLFGAMCGSAVAATATFSKITYPEMEKLGYSPRLSLGVLVAGGCLSPVIPPSATLIIYGAWTFTSLPRLFAGVLVPGLMLVFLFFLTVFALVKLDPSLTPKPSTSTWREKLIAIRDLLPWLGIIVAVLGVIFGGVMTVIEAASLGAALSMVLAAAYRRLSLAAVIESGLTSILITSMVAFLLFTAKIVGLVFVHMGAAEVFSAFMLNLPFGRFGILIIIALIYLIGGMFMEDWAMMLLTLPFVLPIVTGLGYTNVWFGVWFVFIGIAGILTPPFGLNLFVVKSIIPKHDIMEIALAAAPFLIPILMVAGLLIVFPKLAMWLPTLLY
jgi:tripartite ATP-independent transporter DctM subunit